MFRRGIVVIYTFLLSILFISCENSIQPTEEVIITLENATMEKASYIVLWHQFDNNGDLVPEGDYKLNFVSEYYRETIFFNISSKTSPVTTYYKKSDKFESGPKHFALSVYSNENAIGDTVVFHYDVPRKAKVHLYVTKE